MGRPSRMDRLMNEREKGKVTVNSKTYGEHTRAARGTYKKAVLNEAMQAAGRRIARTNIAAKLIRDALTPFLTNFKGGQFWQRLVKHFAAQAKNGEDYSVTGLEFFDINTKYPITNILYSRSMEVNIDMPSLSMQLTCNYTLTERFLKRKSNLDGMQLTVIALFPDFKENDITVEKAVLPVKKIDDKTPYSFILPIPAIATEYMLCWKIEGCIRGIVHEGSGEAAKAVYIEKSGKL